MTIDKLLVVSTLVLSVAFPVFLVLLFPEFWFTVLGGLACGYLFCSSILTP